MSRVSDRASAFAAASVLAMAVFALASCATPSTAGSAPSPQIDADDSVTATAVVGTGTVIEAAGEAKLCAAVLESYPPQCGGGLPLSGWNWDGLEGSETASGVTWGAYAVEGSYDGSSLHVTAPPTLLALYDATPVEETPIPPGTTDEAALIRIQEELVEQLGERGLTSHPGDGRLELTVWFDDGSLQAELDERYGAGVVRVTSALRATGG